MPTLISNFTKRCSLRFGKNDIVVVPSAASETQAPKRNSYHSHTIHTERDIIDPSIATTTTTTQDGDTGGFPVTSTTTEAKSNKRRRSVLATFSRSSNLFKKDTLPLFDIFNVKLTVGKNE
jgi:hypothetical protein